MPSDLILPAFALVLVANAVLIALAIRTFIADRAQERATGEGGRQRRTPGLPSPEPAGMGPDGAIAATANPNIEPVSPTANATADDDRAAAAPTKSRRKRSTAAASTVAASTGDKPTARRRRFSMPAHEEDREKFDRSIASFLSGGRVGRDHD